MLKLVADVPRMEYDIPHAMFMAYRTGRLLQDIVPSPLQDLLPTRVEYLKYNDGSLAVFKKLAVNPRVRIVYPDSMLIDNGRYRVFEENQLFYIDSGHLSSAGSNFVSPVFEPIFQSARAVRSSF